MNLMLVEYTREHDWLLWWRLKIKEDPSFIPHIEYCERAFKAGWSAAQCEKEIKSDRQ